MATEMITMKIDSKFLKDIDAQVKEGGYSSRTEFISAALHDKVDKAKLEEAYKALAPFKGASKHHTTDEEYAEMKRRVSERLLKQFREGLRAERERRHPEV